MKTYNPKELRLHLIARDTLKGPTRGKLRHRSSPMPQPGFDRTGSGGQRTVDHPPEGTDPETNITHAHAMAFAALTSGDYKNFVLMSCFVNGEPAAAIVVVRETGPDALEVMPLFVSITPGMQLTDHHGNPPGE